LLSSGAAVTWAHHAILAGFRQQGIIALIITIGLALIFTAFQGYEYLEAPLPLQTVFMVLLLFGNRLSWISCDNRYHLLLVCLFRLISYHFTRAHHFGFEAAAWYWHMVDVVWLFLFVSVYFGDHSQ
jgi:cytochrome c oxidase subunit 3